MGRRWPRSPNRRAYGPPRSASMDPAWRAWPDLALSAARRQPAQASDHPPLTDVIDLLNSHVATWRFKPQPCFTEMYELKNPACGHPPMIAQIRYFHSLPTSELLAEPSCVSHVGGPGSVQAHVRCLHPSPAGSPRRKDEPAPQPWSPLLYTACSSTGDMPVALSGEASACTQWQTQVSRTATVHYNLLLLLTIPEAIVPLLHETDS